MKHRRGQRADNGRSARIVPWRPGLLLLMLLLLGALFTLNSGSVAASDGDTELEDITPTATSTFALEPPQAPEGAGWESSVLKELAEQLDWPTEVTRDVTGRLTVQHVITGTEWSKAAIRPFDFRAAAQAAFAAEQEDARLAGYSISLDTFHAYPAYWASLVDGRGQVVERRLHWQADAWILGVDIRSLAPRASDAQAIGGQMLLLALQYGLPPAGGTGATPTSVPPAPSATAVPQGCGIEFADVQSGFWAYSYISQLACRGVVSGYSDGTFRPQNSTTRGQLVKMVVLSQGWQLRRPERATFTDVRSGHTFYPYIEAAVSHGIISGYSDRTFRSDEYVTRAQVAKILALSNEWGSPAGGTVTLCDIPRSHWAWSYVQSAVERGVFTGYGDGCFYPDSYATRAQLAKVLSLSGR
jgi:hypothetical protein